MGVARIRLADSMLSSFNVKDIMPPKPLFSHLLLGDIMIRMVCKIAGQYTLHPLWGGFGEIGDYYPIFTMALHCVHVTF